MKVTIKGIVKENVEERFISKMVNHIDLPYFYNLNIFGVPEHLWNKILSIKFNQKIEVRGSSVFDLDGNKIYYEDSDGNWNKYEYDLNGNRIYFENSNGYWNKYEYDSRGNEIYREDSNGYWTKYEYDSRGNLIYRETSDGRIIDKRSNINESFDINYKKYFEWVIERTIKDTKYDVYKTDNGPEVTISFPMYDETPYVFNLDEINYWVIYKNNWLLGQDDINYFHHTYGLNREETEYIINKYISILSPLIYQKMKDVDPDYFQP